MTQAYPIRCRITNEAHTTRVDIFDDIGSGFFGGVSAQDFSGAIARLTGPLDVHINSGGGNVFEGVAIAEALRTYKGRITTYIDGLAASIASVIAQAGAERVMAPGSMMMIHDASTITDGTAAEHEKSMKILVRVSDSIADSYARRAGGSREMWRDRMIEESWYTAEEAVSAGLADRVGGESASWPAGMDVSVFNRAPQHIVASIRQLSARSALKIRNAVMHGDHELYDPDGDGDCDACPDGDTDHDYWAEDGTQLKPVPGKPMKSDKKAKSRKNKVRNADGVDTSDWDGDKAMSNAAKSDSPASFYAAICAGRREGDPSKQDSWALPYRYTPDSAPNAAGVKAALGRIDQTQGLTNKDAALAKLQKLMKRINPDYEPSGSVDPAALSNLLVSALGKGA